jgi:glutathione S-transferase
MASVDTSIHPHASGRALRTVQAHAEPAGEDGLVFYAGWFCPYALFITTPNGGEQAAEDDRRFVQRVWMALEEKGIPYRTLPNRSLPLSRLTRGYTIEYKEENPYKKDKDFLEVSPKGLVPVRPS